MPTSNNFIQAQKSALPFFNAGVADHRSGNLNGAIDYYQKALEHLPDMTVALYNMGIAHVQCDNPRAAIPLFIRAVEQKPNYVEALYNLGIAYERAGDPDKALTAYQKALEIDPNHPKVLNNLGLLKLNTDDLEHAIDDFRRAISTDSKCAEAHFNMGITLQLLGQYEKGRSAYRDALAADNGYAPAKWLNLLSLPGIYSNAGQIESIRERFTRHLEELITTTLLNTEEQKKFALRGVGSTTNFFLQYQGMDDLALQKRYGRFVHEVMAANYPQWSKPMPPIAHRVKSKIRIGYVSSFMYAHTVGDFLLGWVKYHPAAEFEIYCYHLGCQQDAITEAIVSQSTCFRHMAAKGIEATARQISTDELHIVVYPEVGMCPKALQLAAMYLAPVQCAGFWHPVTTGLPTIHYFLSGALLEPEAADSHYSEKLIRLPNIGLCYTPPSLPSPAKPPADFGIPADRFIFVSSQSLYKYLPQHDDIYPRIASQVPTSLFIFISDKHGGITKMFKDRLRAAFQACGLDSHQYCLFLPRLAHADFLSVHMAADVLLDTLEWSGGHTTLEALGCGLPVVTSPGRFLRGRTTYAMLEMMGVRSTIAKDKTEYCRIAVRLARDPDFCQKVKSQISEHVQRLFNDRVFSKGLADFYRSCVSRSDCDNVAIGLNEQRALSGPEYSDKDILKQHWETAIQVETPDQIDWAVDGNQKTRQANPHHAEKAYNLAVTFHLAGRFQEAANAYRKALAMRPGWPDPLFNLAQCLKSQSDNDGAEKCYRQLLAAEPDHVKGAFCLGSLFLLKGDTEQALKWLRHALVRQPEWGLLQNNLGKAYLLKGDAEHARSCLQRAVQLSPDLAEAWFNLAELDARSGRAASAIEHYQRAIAIDPGMLAAYNNMGNALKESKRNAEAIAAFEKVLALDPDLAQGHYNLGSVYRLMDRNEAAILHFSKAIQLHPEYADAWNNLALTCKNIGDWDRAGTYLDRALQIEPNLAVARWNRALLHLLKGNWQAGWEDFEDRFNLPHWRTIYPHRINGRRWDGDPIQNQTLFVHDEQGLGDTFQFVRWLPWAKARCNRLVFETRAEIVPLLKNTLGIDEIVKRPTEGPSDVSFDRYIPLMSIPRLINLSPDRTDGWAPYIVAPETKIAQWKTCLPGGSLRVGLVWAGRAEHGNDANRSCGIDALSPLLQHEAIQFIGLQKGEAERHLDAYSYRNVANLGGLLESFSDTAAVLAQLDLLITVDTSVAHLAGAMGKPVWVLIPHIPDWRWGIGGGHTPWYPTMKLFRQPRPKDWASVVASIDQELKRLKDKRP